MTDNAPPPTQPTDGAYVHRRTGELGARKHIRWYDSTRIQLVGLATAFALITGAVATGYALRDRIRTVDETHVREAQFMAVNEAQWVAINRNTESIAVMRRQMMDAASVSMEILCVVSAETDRQRARCQSEQTRARIQAILTQ
jgi:hypothetical protein